jgi:hypothetical protein
MAEEAIISCCALLYGGNRKVQDVFEDKFAASPALCASVFATIRHIITSCGKGIKPWVARKVRACAWSHGLMDMLMFSFLVVL